MEAHQEMRRRGLYIELTSAVAIAGLKAYLKSTDRFAENIVCPITGHGLKSQKYTTEPS